MARVLFLLPARDFDPSEAAVSWRVLVNAGHLVRFATPHGQPAIADDMMLTGKGLDLWGAVPLLRNLPFVGLLMRANRNARRAYAEMIADPDYLAPLRWDAIDPAAFDALLLPGGVMNPDKLRMEPKAVSFVKAFFDAGKPVAAICHGPWMIIEAGAARGKRIASWPSVRTDLRNAGAEWVDQEAVTDGNLVSARKPDDIPAFNRAMIELFGGARGQAKHATL